MALSKLNITSFCPGVCSWGDLFSLVAQHGEFEEPFPMFYAACVVLDLEELHRKNILHRDLKPENLRVDWDGYLNIVDYGLSKDDLMEKLYERIKYDEVELYKGISKQACDLFKNDITWDKLLNKKV